MKQKSTRVKRIRVPRKTASYEELSAFFDRYDAVELLNAGVTEVDPEPGGPGPEPRRVLESAEHEALEHSPSSGESQG